MSDISFISLLSATMDFLTTTYAAPVWLYLVLLITSMPQFIKIYRTFRGPGESAPRAKKTPTPAKTTPDGVTDNKLKETMVSTVQKLKSMPEDVFTGNVKSTVNKIKNVAHSAGEAASDGIAAAAKKFETEMSATTDKPAPKQETNDKEQTKSIILQKLFTVGDNGRLPQSISSDLGMSKIVTNGYLNELVETNLIAKRKTTLGDTYFITKLGKAFCEQQGFEK